MFWIYNDVCWFIPVSKQLFDQKSWSDHEHRQMWFPVNISSFIDFFFLHFYLNWEKKKTQKVTTDSFSIGFIFLF